MNVNNKKLIDKTIVALYLGESMDWKLGGTRQQLKALSEALVATRDFEQKLMSETTELPIVSEALRVKHAYAREFERVFGQPWPL
jgi:hypothetical protein